MKNELKIGLVVGVALFIFAFLVITIGKVNVIKRGYEFTIRFNYVSGLEDGACVRVSGMSVGSVKEMLFKNNKVYVKVWVKDGIKIPNDSMVTINTLGLLGEKYIEITVGKNQEFIQNGDCIVGINPVNISEILERSEIVVYKMERTVTILDKLMGEKEMLENLTSSLRNLSKITEDSSEIISNNKEELIRIIKDLAFVSKMISEITRESKKDIESTIVEFRDAASSVQKITKAIDREALSNAIIEFNKAGGALSKITKDLEASKIRDTILELKLAASTLNEILKKNEASITEAAASLSRATKNLEELSVDLKKHPWKLLRK